MDQKQKEGLIAMFSKRTMAGNGKEGKGRVA